jgi:16S rRNA (guanine527-N7)-methyltransferase
LERFIELLLEWQGRMNLIGPSTEATIWSRHIADSLQLISLAPEGRIWVDLGSGAGFPGLVIACALAGTPGAQIHLVESSTKKAGFLREVVRETGVPAIVHAERIEDFVKHAPRQIDIVTARALAPLPKLLVLAYPLLKRGATGMFPKGQDVDIELTEAAKCWNIQPTLASSRTDPRSRIVVIRGIEPRNKASP